MACAGGSVGADYPVESIVVEGEELEVWVADTSAERARGLSGLDDLPADIDGMLFEYATPVPASFQMEGTSIELDIWWFDADGALIGGTAMLPCPGPPCPTYGSPGPVRWALETPVGLYDFAVGARLSAG